MNRLSDKAAAVHVLQQLREEVGSFPARFTPKYPVSSIMATERQVAVMRKFADAALCDDDCLGLAPGELERLIEKGKILRARYLLRQWRRGESDCKSIGRLRDLLGVGLDKQSVGLRSSEAEKVALAGCNCV